MENNMNANIEPIQVEGIRITKIDARNEPYSPGRKKKPIEKTRVFIHIENETALQNLMSRFAQRRGAPRRLSPRDMRKHVLQRVVDHLKEKYPQAGITSTSQLRWSTKAGCSMCPCSPGFVAENSYNWSVWVDVAPAEEAVATVPAHQTA